MDDNGEGVAREYLGFVSMSDCKDISISGNSITRVNRDAISLHSGCSDISITENKFRDVCLDNDVSTRYPIRITGNIDGLQINLNSLRNTNKLNNDRYFIGVTGGHNVTRSNFQMNSFDVDNWVLSNISAMNQRDDQRTSCEVLKYTGR